MIKLLTFITIIPILFPNLYNTKFPGSIEYADGTKKEVTFYLPGSKGNGPNLYKIFNKIKYFEGDEKTQLENSICEGFTFYHNNKEYSYKSTSYKDYFLRVRFEGPVTLYYFSHIQCDGNNNCWDADDWILKNEYGEYLKVTFGGAKRKDLANLFRDYEAFANKILNKEINGSDIKDTEKMVSIYNEWKTKQLVGEN